MLFKYINEKTIEILTEEGLEGWFWTEMYNAFVKGDVSWTKTKRSFHEESSQKQNEYLVIKMRRE